MAKSNENLARVKRVGLDLAKNVFQVHGVDAKGEAVIVGKLRRGSVLEFFGRLARCVVAMEACGSAHYWGREIAALGHEVRLIPPAHVKPYVRRNKTDAADAAAICEAALRPEPRFVAPRTVDNQAQVMRHRIREQLVGQRTALLNALRGHLSEIGVIAPQGAQHAYRLEEAGRGPSQRHRRDRGRAKPFASRWRRSPNRSTRSMKRSRPSTKSSRRSRRPTTRPSG